MKTIECDITRQMVDVEMDPSNDNRASISSLCANCSHPWAKNILDQDGPMGLIVRKMFDIYPEREDAQNDIIVLCRQENPTESIF